MAEIIGTMLSPPRIVGHHNYRKNGSNQSAESYYLDAAFIPFLNHFIAEIKSRFGGHNADVLMLQGLIPSWLKYFTDESIIKASKIYAADLNYVSDGELKSELLYLRTKWSSCQVYS